MKTLVAAGLIAMSAAACAGADGGWQVTAEGQTALRPFAGAPYPHDSRKDGFKGSSTTYTFAGHYDDSTVGVFVPSGYRPGKSVDFVVHFHGHLNHVSQVLDQFDLRAQFASSGLNAVLMTPQGPKDAADSGCGRLELEPGALKALLQEVAAFLKAEGKTTTTRIGNVALTAHSGGYKVTSAVLDHGGLTPQITDVLLFDATYGNLTGFANWVAGGKNRRLVSIFTEHLAPENVQLMALLQAGRAPYTVGVERAEMGRDAVSGRGAHFLYTMDLEHNEVVAKRGYFASWLRDAALDHRPLAK